MKPGIARKLLSTYVVIILITGVSGAFCLYVLGVNLHVNTEMRVVTRPSLDRLKEMKAMMLEVKKLANTWVYMANTHDREKLQDLLKTQYPRLDSSLQHHANNWTNAAEKSQYERLRSNNKRIIDTVYRIMEALAVPEDYMDDGVVDYAAELNEAENAAMVQNDKRYTELIRTIEANLEGQQHRITILLHSLYAIVLFTVIAILVVSYVAYRYSRRHIITPLLRLNQTILNLTVGKVEPIGQLTKNDEIGQMHNAVSHMIAGIIDKINFAEQIGRRNYAADFVLLSEKDQLGIALLAMRNNLKLSDEALQEQDKRLIDAQRLARIGNYFYNIETGEFQTSTTLDDILGIDEQVAKTNVNWREHVQPEFHAIVAQRGVKSMKERTKFMATYKINRYNDARECWVNTIGEYNYNEQGRAISMFGTMQDVTKSKNMELELNRSYRMAQEQNNRLLNFSYIVSHNLRMHAVNIHGLLDIITSSDSEDEKQTYLAFLRTASEQLDETLHQLNEVVAMQNSANLQLVPITLTKVIDHTLTLLTTQINNKQALVLNEVAADVVVQYNPVYLDSILLNFLSNAIKYSQPGRRPEIRLSCTRLAAEGNAPQWMLAITDNGLGIDLARNKEKLFGMYKTFHGNADAKGIGLFMAKYQIEAMGGYVDVESTVGVGTTFKIYIK